MSAKRRASVARLTWTYGTAMRAPAPMTTADLPSLGSAPCSAAALAEVLLGALRLAWYATDLLLDTDEALAAVCDSVQGLDAGQALSDSRGRAERVSVRDDALWRAK
jgi:hypothetical protein